MAEWKTRAHLDDHFVIHGKEFRSRSVEEYDASAQATIELGMRFTYRDNVTGERRVGYFHRETARFVGTDRDGFIRTHHRLDEADVADLPLSTYRD